MNEDEPIEKESMEHESPDDEGHFLDLDRRTAYYEALRGYREQGGREVGPCVAVAVNAALLLVDPCDVMWMGLDADVSDAYDSAAARIWQEVCNGLVETAVLGAQYECGLDPDDVVLGAGRADVFGHVPLPVVAEIVQRALDTEYAMPCGLSPEVVAATHEAFDRIVSTEFGSLATIRVPMFARGDEVARLVCMRVGSFPFALVR